MPVAAIFLWLRRRNEPNERCLIIAPLVGLGLLGYVAFFSFVFSPSFGRLFSYVSIISTATYVFFVTRRSWLHFHAGGLKYLPALAFSLGLFYLGILYLPAFHQPYFDQSSLRFIPGLPFDPVIPAVLGDRLFAGEPVRPFMLDWLSSDRPPLQTGLYLFVLPWLKLLSLPEGLGYQCVGTFCQLFWVPATWLMMCALCRERRVAAAGVLILAITGFFLLNSVYVWPKLLAGSYVLFAGLLLIDANPHRPRFALLAGLAAALGWLAHGGVAFSLIALVPIWVIRGCPYWRKIPVTALLFLLIAGPWLWYQKFYDPPGDRLLKWHLAGTIPVDSRPLFEVLRTAYSELSWSEWLDVKLANIRTLFRGRFSQLFDFFTTPGKQRRMEEFFHFFRAIGVLNPTSPTGRFEVGKSLISRASIRKVGPTASRRRRARDGCGAEAAGAGAARAVGGPARHRPMVRCGG